MSDELDRIEGDFNTLARRAAIMWAIRWAIGFLMIWAITAWTGKYDWLWTFGYIVAALSLGFTILAQWLISRKVARTREKMAKLQDALDEEDDL